jgi:hypothetical protein
MATKNGLPPVRFGNVAQDRWAMQVATALRTVSASTDAAVKSVTVISQSTGSGTVTGTADTPTKPTNFAVVGAYNTILLRWDVPVYEGHAVTEVWRSEEDLFGNAIKIAETAIGIWSDPVGPGRRVYYWIRHRNNNEPSETGPLNSTDGTLGETAQDIDELLGLLDGKISEVYFTESLIEKLDLIGSTELLSASEIINEIQGDIEYINIEAIADLAKLGQAEIKAEKVQFVSEKSYALAEQTSFALISEVEARAGEVTRIETEFNNNVATINQTLTATSTAISASAQAINVLQTSVGDVQANYATKFYVGSSIDAAEVSILQSAMASFGSALSGYATQSYASSAANSAAAGTLTTINARFNENTGVYGLQIKTAVDAASAAVTASDSLAAGIYDGNGNLSQAFIDNVSLVAVEADGETIAGAIAAYTVNANGFTVDLQQVASASIASDGNTFDSRFSVKTNVNQLIGGFGAYNDGITTSFIVNSRLFSVIDDFNGQVKKLLTTSSGDPDVPDGVYIDSAFIKQAFIKSLVSEQISTDLLTAAVEITSPIINGGVINSGRYLAQAASYLIDMSPSSTLPIWYGKSSLSKTAGNANFAVTTSGKVYAKGLEVRNAAGQVMMDVDGFNGTYIDDLSVNTLAIGENAITVKSFTETSTTSIAKHGSGILASSVHPHDGAFVGGSVLVSVTFAVLRTSGGSASDYIDLTAMVKDFGSGVTLQSDSVRVGQAYDANQTYFVPMQIFVSNTTADNLQVSMSGRSGGESFMLSAKLVIDSAKR